MIRKSNYNKNELILKIGQSVQEFQEATEAFDYAAAEIMGLNQTDLQCLSIIFRSSPVSASEVAKGSRLTRGAATTALDRIEKAGYAKRIPDPNDRRGVLLQVTAKAEKIAGQLWFHLRDEGGRLLSRYKTSELEAVDRFLTEATKMQVEHTERIKKKS